MNSDDFVEIEYWYRDSRGGQESSFRIEVNRGWYRDDDSFSNEVDGHANHWVGNENGGDWRYVAEWGWRYAS